MSVEAARELVNCLGWQFDDDFEWEKPEKPQTPTPVIEISCQQYELTEGKIDFTLEPQPKDTNQADIPSVPNVQTNLRMSMPRQQQEQEYGKSDEKSNTIYQSRRSRRKFDSTEN